MAALLLSVIYIAFIGLGIPDSLFGTAWPAIYSEFQLPISFASFVSVTICCGTIVSSMLSARVIRRFGTNKVSAFSTALTAAALLGFSFSGNLPVMCLCAIPLGLGSGAIDTALNNYVALHYSATHMSFLHCFFGIGVSVSPFVLSLVIGGEQGWRGGYRIAFCIQLAITVLLAVTLPVWGKVHPRAEAEGAASGRDLRLREIARIPGVKLMWCLFITSCAIECTCGNWASTFLVEYKHAAAEQAARIVMLYYVGMALGRFLSGILATKLDSWRIIGIGQAVLGAALVILLLPGGPGLAALGLFLVGLGNGPLFPNFNYLTPQNFGEEASQAVMGTQMAASYAGIMIAPAVCGLLGQAVHMGIFPFYLLAFYLVMLAAARRARRLPRRDQGRA
ncbi:MAG: MFS transporter [Oscillospiraceae bacterium]|nr:MFS transporter [Oscillospiraceae bacterium]